MTLIAGFKAHGTPFLLGDFVLSAQGERAGVRKKVHRLGPNCCVAWTGHLIAANPVFRTLRERFDGHTLISKQELEQILSAFHPSDFGETNVVLVGWVIEDDQFCFRWRSDWPQELIPAEPAYDGSGSPIIQKWGGEATIHDASDPNLADLDLAIDTVLGISTNLMSQEIFYSEDLKKITFGHAYEILYFEDAEFRYVDNVLYFAITIEFDNNGKVMSSDFAPVFYKYRVLGEEYSLTECHENPIGTTVNFITPVGSDYRRAKEFASSFLRAYQFDMAARYYCVFVRLIAPDFTSPFFSLIQRADAPAALRLVEGEGKEISFKLPDAWAENWYNTIRGDQQAEK